MASSIGIDGLISGLDTTSMIDQLMAVEGNNRTLLASKKTNLQSLGTALTSLNTKIASLATAATTAAKDSSWQTTKATSSSTAVTAVTSSTAQPATLSMTVTAVAASQSTLYSMPTAYGSDTPSFTITRNGESTTVTAASTSIADILEALNGKDTGVTASAINVGTSASPVYKLQINGTETGAEQAFTVTADDATTGTMTGQQLRAASDASVTLWPGTDGATTLTSASNTFTGLMTGVDVTVSATTTDPVTLTVARSSSAMSTLASNLVTNLTTVLGDITDRTKSTTTTADDGGTILTGGLFSGNSTIRMLQQSLLDVASVSVDGMSAAQAGINLDKDGNFTFDSETFATAYAADPEKVQALIQKMATSLQTVAEAASNSTTGSITTQITSNTSEVDDLADRIASWDDRLATRREALVKIYAAMEVSLATMQSTSNYLTQQIASLNSSSSSS